MSLEQSQQNDGGMYLSVNGFSVSSLSHVAEPDFTLEKIKIENETVSQIPAYDLK